MALKQLLLDLKKYSFSGYVRTVRPAGGGRAEGIILLRGGNPEASLHQQGEAHERGRGALKKVWQDSYDEACTIELHARVDMDGLIQEYGDAILERPAKVIKRAKVPQPMDRAEVEGKVRAWKERGYEVGSVTDALDGDPAILTAACLALQESIRKADAVAETLADLDLTGFEARGEALRAKLRDPIHNPDIDAEVESLRDAVESHRQVEARHALELARERDSQERTKKVVELVMKQRSLEPKGPPTSQEEVTRVLEGPSPTRDQSTNLIQQYTFDTFVVGESNRFARTAAFSAAQQPAGKYNPLVVVSGPGLGKTHLLHAIGNVMRSRSNGNRVLFLTCESFAAAVAEAKAHGTLAEFRDRGRGSDAVLLDDLQAIAKRPEVQAEILGMLADTVDAGTQFVFASDRPPKAIADVDDRLVARLESGLITAIEAPERSTRIAILEHRAREANARVDAAVLAFIADLVEDNIRELLGAFNRVVAFSSLMSRPITTDLAKEVLREVLDTTAREEKAPSTAPAVLKELKPGRSYLIEEDRPEEAFRLLASALGGRHDGLVITRTNPKRAREMFPIAENRILWLTDRESTAEETIAPALERIVYEIERFLGTRPRGAILLDGVEYLVSNNSFDAVLKFVRRVVDTISEGHFVFLISMGPGTLKDQELKMFEREMEVVRVG